jgi:hypothetical protein
MRGVCQTCKGGQQSPGGEVAPSLAFSFLATFMAGATILTDWQARLVDIHDGNQLVMFVVTVHKDRANPSSLAIDVFERLWKDPPPVGKLDRSLGPSNHINKYRGVRQSRTRDLDEITGPVPVKSIANQGGRQHILRSTQFVYKEFVKAFFFFLFFFRDFA